MIGPTAEPIRAVRLTLEPLTAGHADEMTEVLAAPELYAFIGGAPPAADELRARYERLTAGPPAGRREGWLNWVIRLHEDHHLAGFVQATITPATSSASGELQAAIAWVVGAGWQGRGIATEAAQALVGWLIEHEVSAIIALIHPDHAASAAVARHAGLAPTADRADGEVVWKRPRHQDGEALGVRGHY
ncbi:MAG TPA: GNAT family N-acetyltransferase [Streptosporangiaceae bacterium]